MLLRKEERHGLANLLAACLRDRRKPVLVTHTLAEMLRFRMRAAAYGYEDADDCDTLRAPSPIRFAWSCIPAPTG